MKILTSFLSFLSQCFEKNNFGYILHFPCSDVYIILHACEIYKTEFSLQYLGQNSSLFGLFLISFFSLCSHNTKTQLQEWLEQGLHPQRAPGQTPPELLVWAEGVCGSGPECHHTERGSGLSQPGKILSRGAETELINKLGQVGNRTGAALRDTWRGRKHEQNVRKHTKK